MAVEQDRYTLTSCGALGRPLAPCVWDGVAVGVSLAWDTSLVLTYLP